MKTVNGLQVFTHDEAVDLVIAPEDRESYDKEIESMVKEVKKIRDLDVVSHPAFQGEIIKVVEQIKQQRWARPPAKEGFRYKRNWIDQLITSNQFNSDFFLDNALSALMRQSPLPAALRQPVLDVALTAFFATKEIIEKENEKD